MNFYKHHLGDYDGATMHLSWDEDQAYTRLLRVYYRLEKPIPLEPGATFRLVRAITKTQKEAVTRVLHEFFKEQGDGWHNARADEEIAAYQAQAATNTRIARQRTERRSAHDPDNDSLPDRSPNHKPVTRTKNHKPAAKAAKVKDISAGDPAAGRTVPVWKAYAEAYEQRYGVEPVRNRRVNGMLAQYVDKLPESEAPLVAAFYVTHSKGLYVSAKHCVDLLLRDAEGLRTEWATGRKVTDSAARHADETATRGDQAERLIAAQRSERKVA